MATQQLSFTKEEVIDKLLAAENVKLTAGQFADLSIRRKRITISIRHDPLHREKK